MSQQDKAAYYQALKQAGVQFSKHYREYSTDELAAAWQQLKDGAPELELPDAPEPPPAAATRPPRPTGPPAPPVAERDPNEMAGQRLNTQPYGEPIRTDEQGRVWYQEEVLKPGYAKPRGRRVLQYTDTGTETKTVQQGQFQETFEVAGKGPAQVGQIKITLPSYQAGIYKDPRFPFKIHVYNGVRGFDFFEVQDYWGGAELVPAEVKRMYVENVLCYDIRTTVQAIERAYRQIQLSQGRERA